MAHGAEIPFQQYP